MAIDTVKGSLPFQPQLRHLKDRVRGYQRCPTKDRQIVGSGLAMLAWLGDVRGRQVLEVGTGWQPIIPILCSLAGAHVFMTDKYELLRPDTFAAALEAIREHADWIASSIHVTPAKIRHAVRPCSSLQDRFGELRLTYLAPCDCAALSLSAASVDVVLSRAVMEHIEPPTIARIFREAHRILRPGGLMLHKIDHSDHWSHRDPSITAVNFLRYPDWLFRLTYGNPLNYQNRLRHSEYVAMAREAGFTVLREERTVDPVCQKALQNMPLAARFQRFAVDDLATTSSTLLAATG